MEISEILYVMFSFVFMGFCLLLAVFAAHRCLFFINIFINFYEIEFFFFQLSRMATDRLWFSLLCKYCIGNNVYNRCFHFQQSLKF